MVDPAILDDVDRALLAQLQIDARVSQSSLGARVGLSAAAVNRRIRRLTDDGYVTGIVAVLDAAKLGHPLSIVVQIEAVSEEVDRLDRLQSDLVASRHVQQCYYVTGEWDFVLIVQVRDMDQYRELTRQLLFANGNVRRFKTLVVMNHAKVGRHVPLEPR